MSRSLLVLSVCALLVAGCSDTESSQSGSGSVLTDVTSAVDGVVFSATQYVGTVIDSVKFIKNDVDTRIDKVSTGLEKMREGKDLIDEGLGLGEDQASSATENEQ